MGRFLCPLLQNEEEDALGLASAVVGGKKVPAERISGISPADVIIDSEVSIAVPLKEANSMTAA